MPLENVCATLAPIDQYVRDNPQLPLTQLLEGVDKIPVKWSLTTLFNVVDKVCAESGKNNFRKHERKKFAEESQCIRPKNR